MRKRQFLWSVAGVFACTVSCVAASTVTVEPGDVTALTNYMATLSGGSTIILKAGVYDLSQVHGTCSDWGYYHLIANGKRLVIKGQNTKHWSEKTPEEETILRGDGTAAILYGHGGGGRQTSVWHISFENGYRPEKAPDGTGIGSFGGGALSWAQTEQGKPALGNGLASNCVFRGCSSAYNGGATCGVDAFDCFYTNNTCAKAGGAARGFVGNNNQPVPANHTNIFKNCVFIDNKALGGAGGAIYGQMIDSLIGCTFIGNTASSGGGGVYCESPISVVTNCTFIGNTATTSHGGGLECASAVGAITDCVFTSGNRGGGLLCSETVGTISGCVFKGNTANGIGGGLRVNGNAERIVGCKFLDNTAEGYGGGCSSGASSFFGVEDCEFTSNKVNVATDCYGGGLATIASVSRISGSTFTGNLSLRDGGALYFRNTATVTNCTFRENVARQYAGGVLDFDARGTVVDSLFDGNTNSWGNFGSHVRKVRQVTGCTFTGWGDMLATSYDRCTFDGCKFNFVTWADGMVQFAPATGAGHIRNCLFKGCSVHTLIYNNTAAKTLEIANCTFVSNNLTTMSFPYNGSTQSVSPYLILAFRAGTEPNSGKAYPNTNVVANCIFWNNRRDGVRNYVTFYATSQSTIPGTVALNIVSNAIYGVRDASKDSGSTVVAFDFDVVPDPRFVAGDPKLPGVPYYMIRRGSPAVNAGTGMDWMADAVDLAGTNRVIEARVDLGCYECWLPETGTMIMFR